MRQIRTILALAVLALTMPALGQGANGAPAARAPEAQRSPRSPAARVVDLRASDGTLVKASYFGAAKPGPGVLLFHQINRTRKSWDAVAGRLAAAGIHTLT